MPLYTRLNNQSSTKLKENNTWLEGIFLKENILPSVQVGIIFTIFHEIIVDFFDHISISIENFLNFTTILRLLSIAVVTLISFSIISSKNRKLRKDEKINSRLIQILSETGKMAKVGGWELDVKTRTQMWSQEIYRMVEIEEKDADKILPKDMNFYAPLSKPIIKAAVKKAIESGESYDLELEIITSQGNHKWVHTTGKANYENGKIVSISGAIQDITEKKKINDALLLSEEKYKMLSIVDELTNLYNSRHFHNELQKEINRVNRHDGFLTLILLDIDNFKKFNDTYGHVEGDHVLSRFGKVVTRCLRETDSSYRYGGEEFTIILPSSNLKKGILVAEKIRKEFKSEIFSVIPGQDTHVTISIGVAQYTRGENAKDFIKRVDSCMYIAKKCGKDRVFAS
jgi:diguanylate cyclase (GGDEF)-like protein/PAS domain S-box-containing protein